MDMWSRRRAAVAAEDAAARAADAARRQAEADAGPAERPDAELLAELGLPEPESLDASGDFRAFLREGVPQRLRRRALRHLWRVNPVLANLDGLNDYDEDFRAVGDAPVRTLYRVGSGLRDRITELAEAAREKAEAAEEESDGIAPDADPPAPEPVAAVAAPPEPPEDIPPAARRRMRFTFPTEGTA